MTEQNGVERSTATDILSAMLDERGVKWHNLDSESDHGDCRVFKTWWKGNLFYEESYPNGDSYTLLEARAVEGITPEQAVEATLGSCNCSNSERTSDELLPCPFCGGEAEIVHTPKVIPYEPWWIRCPFCEVTTPKYKSDTAKADAIAAWNRRAEHD